jgi:hypothetical protein
MNPMRMAVWLVGLAFFITLSVAAARAGEFTVIGSPPQGQSADISYSIPMGTGATPAAPGTQPLVSGGSASTTDVSVYPEHWYDACNFASRPLDRCWYARFDYYSWKEQYLGDNLVDEHGTLYTVGYVRTNGAKRVRAEFFTGTMNYTPGDLPRSTYQLDTTSRVMGTRVEFELLWDVHINDCVTLNFFSGIGGRFWIRDIQDRQVTSDIWIDGHQEDWFTLYPYIGMERRWNYDPCMDFFLSCRIGSTAWTYQSCSELGGPVLHPQACMTGQIEFGLQYQEHLVVSLYFDAMTWVHSGVVDDTFQPNSQLYTTGIKLGLSF